MGASVAIEHPTQLRVRYAETSSSPELAFHLAIAKVQQAVIEAGFGRSLPAHTQIDLLSLTGLTPR